MKHKLKANTLFGLENILAKEIESIGGENIEKGLRYVSFTGDNEVLYRANIQLRTALNILKEVAKFELESKADLYAAIKKFEWTKLFSVNQSFSVKTEVKTRFMKNMDDIALDIREDITRQFKNVVGQRPNGEKFDPNILLHFVITDDVCELYMNSSGKDLNKRVYSEDSGFDPLNSVLAAGIIMHTVWEANTNFVDPMCGSGTLLAEAGMIARNVMPNIQRANFAFKQWKGYDADLFNKIIDELKSKEIQSPIKIEGGDKSERAVKVTRRALNRLGLSRVIKLQECQIQEFEPTKEPGLLIINPPHFTKLKLVLDEGEELEPEELETKQKHIDKENDIKFEDESEFYKMIGNTLKINFKEYDCWILSGNPEYFYNLGGEIKKTIQLFNTSIESELINVKF